MVFGFDTLTVTSLQQPLILFVKVDKSAEITCLSSFAEYFSFFIRRKCLQNYLLVD